MSGRCRPRTAPHRAPGQVLRLTTRLWDMRPRTQFRLLAVGYAETSRCVRDVPGKYLARRAKRRASSLCTGGCRDPRSASSGWISALLPPWTRHLRCPAQGLRGHQTRSPLMTQRQLSRGSGSDSIESAPAPTTDTVAHPTASKEKGRGRRNQLKAAGQEVKVKRRSSK